MYRIERYTADYFDLWNGFVATSKNGTFLFHRNFMEYHADRFTDYSLLVFQESKLVALLPANVQGDIVYSHRGLTYGGLILQDEARVEKTLTVFKTLLQYLNEQGIYKLELKSIPFIYHKKQAQELEYALFLANAKLIRRDSLSVITNPGSADFSVKKLQSILKGQKKGLKVREDNDFKSFWQYILIPNLSERHNAAPVHTLEEMELLHKQFPDNIRQFNVYLEDKIVAGATLFVSETVAHVQYISGNEQKNVLGSVDYLFSILIKDIFKDIPYFDFGSSNENGGRVLNGGLSFWKEGFGSGTVAHDFYEVSTENYKFLP